MTCPLIGGLYPLKLLPMHSVWRVSKEQRTSCSWQATQKIRRFLSFPEDRRRIDASYRGTSLGWPPRSSWHAWTARESWRNIGSRPPRSAVPGHHHPAHHHMQHHLKASVITEAPSRTTACHHMAVTAGLPPAAPVPHHMSHRLCRHLTAVTTGHLPMARHTTCHLTAVTTTYYSPSIRPHDLVTKSNPIIGIQAMNPHHVVPPLMSAHPWLSRGGTLTKDLNIMIIEGLVSIVLEGLVMSQVITMGNLMIDPGGSLEIERPNYERSGYSSFSRHGPSIVTILSPAMRTGPSLLHA